MTIVFDKFHYIIHKNLDKISVSSETTQPLHDHHNSFICLLQGGTLQQQGKMTSLIYFAISLISICTILSTNTMPELKKNVLNFRYGTNLYTRAC